MRTQSHPGRVTSNINIYTQRKQHTLSGTHSCILSPAQISVLCDWDTWAEFGLIQHLGTPPLSSSTPV